MQNIIKNSVLILSIIFSFSASARYANQNDAQIEVNLSNLEISVEKSGKYTSVVEKEITILNEAGRNNYGSQTLYFTKATSDLEIIEAKSFNDGAWNVVTKESMEIKPLASSEKGFDQKYQILISFPNVNIGSKLYLKYKETVHTPSIENHFQTILDCGINEYTIHSKTKIISEIPFEYKVADIDKNLDVHFVKDKKRNILTMELKKPVFYQLYNEPETNQLDTRKVSQVYITSIKDYNEMGKYFAPKYDNVLRQDLPESFAKIVAEAEKIKDENQQIDYVTSSLADIVRYMGSWQTVNGRFFPRDLKVIAETGYGDCKDFSTATAAMLYRLGYKVNSAFVFRGGDYIESTQTIPVWSFNHAILTANGKSGKKYWVDPTNFVSMSSGIFSDISSRHSLVLDKAESTYEFIPSIDPKHSSVNREITINLINDKIQYLSKSELKGERAMGITGAELQASKAALEESIFTYFSGETKPGNKQINLPTLKSRIVSDVKFDFSFEKDDDRVKSNLGKGVTLSNLEQDWANNIVKLSEDNVGSTYLGDPNTYNYKTIIKNYKATTPEALNFEINSKWFTAKRKCTQAGKDLIVEETASLINPIVLPEEYSLGEFKDLQKNIKQNMRSAIVIGSGV